MRLFICALWSAAGKGLTSWLSFVLCYFPIGILGQVWYLIVSIPDRCTLTYIDRSVFLLCVNLHPVDLRPNSETQGHFQTWYPPFSGLLHI